MIQRRKKYRGAFSLVEILIVVVILGILAAIAVPKLSNASQVSRENSLKEDLRLLRTEIGVYKVDHADTAPGYPGGDTSQTPTTATLTAQLTRFTNVQGYTASAYSRSFPLGPYLAQMPVNPVNSLSTWKILSAADSLTPDGSTGWLYQPSTGQVKPNVIGADLDGRSFSEY